MSDGKSEAMEAMNAARRPLVEQEGTPEYYLAVASSRLAKYRAGGGVAELIDAKDWARCAMHHMDRVRLGLDR
jgi:hypothetical protein